MQKESEEKIDPHQRPYLKDYLPTQVYHVAMRGIVAVVLTCVIGIILLSLFSKNSEGLVSIASACIGGLVGIFAERTAGNSK